MHANRPVLALVTAALTSLALTACATAEAKPATSSAAASSTEQAATAPSDVTIDTARGEVTVATNPTTVVVFEHGILDTIDALGFGDSVAVVPHHVLPSYLSDYADTTTNGGTLFEPDFEAVNAADPDLIIVGGRSAATYDEMAKIAPTIDLTFEWGSDAFVESFERNTRAIGAIFGAADEADAAIAAVNAQAADVTEKAADAGNGLVVLTSGGQLSAYGPAPEGRYDFIYHTLGLGAATDQGTIDSHGDSISYEFLAQTNPSWLVVIDRDAAIGAEGESAQQLLNNDLVNAPAAATSGRIAYVVPEYWYLAFGGLTATSAVYAEISDLVE
jgi:iron complex transport system substrate-binding protein